MPLDELIDPYTMRARVFPGSLVLTPILVTFLAVSSGEIGVLGAMGLVLLAAGALFALSHLVREAGKRREVVLWSRWGGKPTTAVLRWRGDWPEGQRERLRQQLAEIASDVSLPTRSEEADKPREADQRYDMAVSVLREATRDPERYPVVFSENVSYGFRRNAYAIRHFGIASAVSSVIALGAFVSRSGLSTDIEFGPVVPALAVDISFALFWAMVVSERWVRKAADAYAAALFAAASAVPRQRAGEKR